MYYLIYDVGTCTLDYKVDSYSERDVVVGVAETGRQMRDVAAKLGSTINEYGSTYGRSAVAIDHVAAKKLTEAMRKRAEQTRLQNPEYFI